ncbi:VOC family protein [bacterium]|nr:MAG: VOC family protein [bacterium]
MKALNSKASSAIVAVSDIDRARRFYGETLGLDLLDDKMDGVLVYQTGATRLTVYLSGFAGTNKANAVVWDCGSDVDPIVSYLAAKGVTFERYEMEGVSFAGGIHRAGDLKMVWFKDPDGNILHLNGR